MGHDPEMLKRAKAAGCPAFKLGSRVNLFELEEWIATHPDFAAINVQALTEQQAATMEKVAKALQRRDSYQRARRQLIPVEEVRRTFTRSIVASKARLLSIASTLCQRFALCEDATEIEREIKSAVIDALSELQKSEWAGCKCAKCGEAIS